MGERRDGYPTTPTEGSKFEIGIRNEREREYVFFRFCSPTHYYVEIRTTPNLDPAFLITLDLTPTRSTSTIFAEPQFLYIYYVKFEFNIASSIRIFL